MNITTEQDEIAFLQFKASCNNEMLTDSEIEVIMDKLPIYNLDSMMSYFEVVEETRPQLFEKIKKDLLK